MNGTVLGTLSHADFLRRYWQKRPLYLPAAVPEVRDLFSASELRALAYRDDVEARLVTQSRGRWDVRAGPFERGTLKHHPSAARWSLLVQGVDLHVAKARALLERFTFVPYARLDDVMLSLAPPCGGVGPHFDSYDVFLLQVHGRRRWRIGAQRDLRLVDGAPLRILRNFRAQREIEAEPGDLLYLPPRYAHDGIALTECITCSIGFRAPSRHELAAAFMQWLPERHTLSGRYSDPDLVPQAAPARIGNAMIDQVAAMMGSIKWRRKDVAVFLGEYLTEPKPHVWFEGPAHPMSKQRFLVQVRARGIALSLKTRMLYDRSHVYMNGESFAPPASAMNSIRTLADERLLKDRRVETHWLASNLYAWYRSGYVELGPR